MLHVRLQQQHRERLQIVAHENELKKISGRNFAGRVREKLGLPHRRRNEKIMAGCHRHPMWGAIGKTQFMDEELPILTSEGGKWVN